MTGGTAQRYTVREHTILDGKATVVGTLPPLRAVVELWRLGLAPEEIPGHLPHLTRAQAFDALSDDATARGDPQLEAGSPPLNPRGGSRSSARPGR